MGLAGRRAIVTGGTRSIGRAIAERFAEEGCAVAICARDARRLDEAVTALKQRGVAATGAALDVADGAKLKAWIATAAGELGGLDILVANVSALAEGSSAADFKRAFEVDLLGTVNAVEAALPYLEQSDSGAIVAIDSISGVEDYGFGEVAYGASKAALLFYMKSLANHLAPKGIRANVVSPGTIYCKGGVWHQTEQNDPLAFQKALAANPMRRMGTPEEIANVVAFVASPRASFMAGANVVVDGAFTRRIQN